MPSCCSSTVPFDGGTSSSTSQSVLLLKPPLLRLLKPEPRTVPCAESNASPKASCNVSELNSTGGSITSVISKSKRPSAGSAPSSPPSASVTLNPSADVSEES